MTESEFRDLCVLLVGPEAPPVGGMTVQAAFMRRHLLREGARVVRLPTNPAVAAPIGRIPLVGGAARLVRFRSRLRRAISRGADVLHVQSASWQYFWRVSAFALREGRDAGLRTVLRYDGGEADRFFAQDPARVRAVLDAADEVVVPSGYLAEVFERRVGVEARIVPNLVHDPGVERPTTRPTGPLRLLCARHLEPDYGIDVVIRAVAHAAGRGAEIELSIAGDGAERERLETLAERHFPGGVRFLGRVPHSEILETLAATDLVVNASRVDNFPVALAEALAAGVPVASTDAGGIPWVVKDGITGRLVPVDDADALGDLIHALASDREQLVDMGWSAKLEALRWTWDAVRGEWADAYGVG